MGNVQIDKEECVSQAHVDQILLKFSKSLKEFLSPEEEIKGTGIGLAHCKKIVETHREKIWLESEEGKGTTIFLQLPLAI